MLVTSAIRYARTSGTYIVLLYVVSDMSQTVSVREKFGSLRLTQATSLSRGSHKKVGWTCDCGKKKDIVMRVVTSGRTRRCGRCNTVSAEEMAERKFGKLRMEDPTEVTSGSNRKTTWACDCGGKTDAILRDVIGGHTSSCGRCSGIGQDEMAERKFGKLRMKDPVAVSSGSNRKAVWTCDCGRESPIAVKSVITGLSKSCGKCSTISMEEMSGQRFGRLRMKNPESVRPGSAKKAIWTCDCDRETRASVNKVVSGHTSSCGMCWTSVMGKFEENVRFARSLRTPISPDQVPDGFPKPIETITAVSMPFRARCQMCGGEHFPRWDGVRLGKSLTCGCSTGRVSAGHRGIAEFLMEIGASPEVEHHVGHWTYDLFVPSSNLLVEFNGLNWHSMPDSRRRDLEKYRDATTAGFEYVMIYEDEWALNRKKVENLLKSRVSMHVAVGVRPGSCKISPIPAEEADPFYAEHHYIGPCRSRINYGVRLNGLMIACASFKKPTRQSAHPWELVRMASDPAYRVHGVWSKLLSMFVQEHSPTSVVSFSDNRLFSGDVYRKMGFRLDGDVRPDYYWWKNKRRHHKSSLRKPSGSTQTESEIRTAEGYRKVWDLGKKRWVFTP